MQARGAAGPCWALRAPQVHARTQASASASVLWLPGSGLARALVKQPPLRVLPITETVALLWW